ncbi:MAG: hypothetical protein ABW186_18545 [Rhodanobacteraceae bacterium]
MHEHAAQPVRRARIRRECNAAVSIETIKAVLGSEPHETLVVLSDLADARLRKFLRVFRAPKRDVVAFNEHHGACQRGDTRLGREFGITGMRATRGGMKRERAEEPDSGTRKLFFLVVAHASFAEMKSPMGGHESARPNRRGAVSLRARAYPRRASTKSRLAPDGPRAPTHGVASIDAVKRSAVGTRMRDRRDSLKPTRQPSFAPEPGASMLDRR